MIDNTSVKKTKPRILKTDTSEGIRFFHGSGAVPLLYMMRKGCESMYVSRKKWACRTVLWTFLFLSGVVVWNQAEAWQGDNTLRQTEASTSSSDNSTVLLGGMPVGIYMETDGVLVLDTETIEGTDGNEYEPAADIVEAGDYITAVNHQEISGKADLLDAVGQIDGSNVVLTLRRGEDTLDIEISPVEYETGQYRLGIWVRDNVQGLGTITFLTGQSRFGALGHGISDTDTNTLMTIAGGRIYRTSIQDITKGYSGSPGTMEGIIVYNKYNILGTIDKNTDAGIYGTIDKIDELFDEQIPIETASTDEIEIGDAKIRCYIDNEISEYDISVTDIDMSSSEINKGLMIRVTDPELLEKTGGIIQGMSGSPIIQNGKLIGAVTHVFVQDSTMGYGIFIENMLNQVESSDVSKIVSN